MEAGLFFITKLNIWSNSKALFELFQLRSKTLSVLLLKKQTLHIQYVS